MEGCCVCLDEYITLIINSGWSVCNACLHKLDRRCPSTRIEITIKLPNNFAGDFYQYPLPPPDFDMKDLLDSSDKIAYMNQFDKIKIYNPDLLISDGRCVLNLDEFKSTISKKVKSAGGNAVDNFNYVQKGTVFSFSSTRWKVTGRIIKA